MEVEKDIDISKEMEHAINETINKINTEGVKIYKWNKTCWKCGKTTNVVSYSFFGVCDHNIGDIEELDMLLMEKYSFVKKIFSKTMDCEVIANTCIHCGSLQGNFFILEDLVELMVNNDEDLTKFVDLILYPKLSKNAFSAYVQK